MALPCPVRAALVVVAASLACPLASLAGVEVVLRSGQTIAGRSAQRDGDLIRITLDDTDVMTVAASSVTEIRLTADPPAEPSILGGQPAAPGQAGPEQAATRQKRAPAVPGEAQVDEAGRPPQKNRPQTLSGPKVKPPTPEEQHRAIGQKATFAKTGIDPNWSPADTWAGSRWEPEGTTWSTPTFDPTWVPESAYDMKADVNAYGRVRWPGKIIEPTWTPGREFGRGPQPKPGVVSTLASGTTGPRLFTGGRAAQEAARAAAAETVESVSARAWGCAELLFAAASPVPSAPPGRATALAVTRVDDPLYAGLPLPLFAGEGTLAGIPRRGLFTTAGGCRLLGGDLVTLLDQGAAKGAPSRVAAEVGAAMLAAGVRWPANRSEELDLALAVAALADPAVSGASVGSGGSGISRVSGVSTVSGVSATAPPQLVRIDEPNALFDVVRRSSRTCRAPRGERDLSFKRARQSLRAPSVTATPANVRTISLFTWSPAGGKLVRQTLIRAADGALALEREVIGTHLGEHSE